jgi:hypothetical protein
MRVALLLSGHMRYFKECYSSLKRSILDPLNPDIYVHTWDENDRSMWQDKAYKIDTTLPDNIFKKIVIEQWSEHEPFFEKMVGSFPGCHNTYSKPNRVLSMYYKIWQCFQLIKDEEYDVVIRARPDLFYTNILDRTLLERKDDFLFLPKSHSIPRISFRDLSLDFECDSVLYNGTENIDSYFVGEPNDCYGYLDQFCIGSYKFVKKYCNTYNCLEHLFKNGCRFSPEEFIKAQLDENNITPERNDLKIYILRNWKYL